MLNNADKKIVLWSKILLYAGIAISVVLGFMMIWNGAQYNGTRLLVYRGGYLYHTGFEVGGRMIIAGFLVMILGSLASWLIALLLRAFGDLTADTKAIRERLDWTPADVRTEAPAETKTEVPAQAKPARAKPTKPATVEPDAPAEAESEEPDME